MIMLLIFENSKAMKTYLGLRAGICLKLNILTRINWMVLNILTIINWMVLSRISYMVRCHSERWKIPQIPWLCNPSDNLESANLGFENKFGYNFLLHCKSLKKRATHKFCRCASKYMMMNRYLLTLCCLKWISKLCYPFTLKIAIRLRFVHDSRTAIRYRIAKLGRIPCNCSHKLHVMVNNLKLFIQLSQLFYQLP